MLKRKLSILVLCGLLAAAGAGGGAYWLWTKVIRPAPAAVGRMLSDALGEALHARPRVTVRQYVVVEEVRPIAELAMVSRATDVQHHVETEQFFSKARLNLRATFTVKAGFDLRAQEFALDLDPGLRKARLNLPLPRVLSLEMTHYEILQDRDGWWHRISNADRELALRQLHAAAKLEAVRAGILADCRRELEKNLAGVSARTGVALDIVYAGQDSLPHLSLPARESLR